MKNKVHPQLSLFYMLFGAEDACLPVGREDRNAQLLPIGYWDQTRFILLFSAYDDKADNLKNKI
jgi:hypothetical protein